MVGGWPRGTGDGNAALTAVAVNDQPVCVVTNAANINGKNAASVIVTAELPPL